MIFCFPDLADEFYKALGRAIERRLIGRIEEIEDRVPTDAEIAHYGCKVIFPDGRQVFTWKGVQIVEVVPPSEGKWNYTING